MECKELKNWGPDKSTLRVPRDSFPPDKQPSPSLSDIRLIKARKCSIDKDCLVIENTENASFCVYLGAYPNMARGCHELNTKTPFLRERRGFDMLMKL
jgi:hypothetical protein